MHAAAGAIIQHATTAIARSGRFVIALSGGTTPVAVYELLASPAFASHVDWGAWHVCFGDERCVAPDDAQSNYRMARLALLDRVSIPPAHVHRMHGEDAPDTAAWTYERELRTLFATPTGRPGLDEGHRFDLVLLGLGADGHTASLFPNGAGVHESTRWVVPATHDGAAPQRLTLTLPVINASAQVMFLVTGESKADTLRQVLEHPADAARLPAQGVLPSHGALEWLVDAAASSGLPGPPCL